MQRGVIAAPAIIHAYENGFTVERSLSPEELRYYALYWDKVVIPASNVVYLGIHEEEVLIQTGVISRPTVQFTGSISNADIGYILALSQAEVAKKLIEEEKTTDWVMHQIGPYLWLPPDFAKEARTLKFELVNLLPVPYADVPIPDILEFKERRRDELSGLHKYLDDAYLEVLRSPDAGLSGKIAIANLKAAISDLDAVSTERWQKTRKHDFSAELNVEGGNVVKGAAAGAIFDFFLSGMTIPVGAIAGAAMSMFKLSAKSTFTFEPAQRQLKLSYLSRARDEQIIVR